MPEPMTRDEIYTFVYDLVGRCITYDTICRIVDQWDADATARGNEWAHEAQQGVGGE